MNKLKTKQNILEGWMREKFNSRLSLQYGSGLPESKRVPGPVPVYGSNGQVGAHSEPLIKGPSIIIGRKGTIGTVVWSEFDSWPIDTTYYIEEDGSLDLRWLYYQLQTLGLSRMNSASGTPGLNREEVYKLNVDIPPFPEQKKIAEILGAVDEEIQKTNEIISAAEKLKRGLMQKLFTHGIGHTKFKKTKIGEIPEEWKVAKLSDVVQINPEQVDPTKNKFQNQIFKYIDIGSISDHKITDIKEFIGADAPIRARRVVQSDDVIVSTVRPNLRAMAKIAIGTKNLLVSTGFCVLRGTEKIFPEYLYQLSLTGWFTQYLVSKTTGSNYPAVNTEAIGDFVFPLPDFSEQQRIADILSSVDEKILANQELKSKIVLLKKGLMQDLLSGSKRVKI